MTDTDALVEHVRELLTASPMGGTAETAAAIAADAEMAARVISALSSALAGMLMHESIKLKSPYQTWVDLVVDNLAKSRI